jgi:hypothetical protein
MRDDASQLPKNIWTNVYSYGADNKFPSSDSRAMVFDDNGKLLHGSDRGVYLLSQRRGTWPRPTTTARSTFYLLRLAEVQR